ncbi:hypothetical protein RN001_005541 [Aquatica leii]|uniref:Uncharacterized protein n=1 Tax=Aquatica leii TaxID=1421715 RepID=A0AAN7PC19_9COLE|nr:hypothetical protein RN001_005541 [Aquatica leii]
MADDPGDFQNSEQNSLSQDELEKMQNDCNIILPEYIKKLLKITGFDTKSALSDFQETDINYLEKFAAEEIPNLFPHNLESYLNIYAKNPKSFKIVLGHKKVLMKFCETLRTRKNVLPLTTKKLSTNSSDTNLLLDSRLDSTDLTEENAKLLKTIKNWIAQRSNNLNIDKLKATSYEEMEKQFQEESCACYAYTVMAQPLDDKAPSFCLAIFGTDNKFSSETVLTRWRKIKELSSNIGIKVVGYSSDGDIRLMKCMKYLMQKLSDDDIHKTIQESYTDACDILKSLNINPKEKWLYSMSIPIVVMDKNEDTFESDDDDDHIVYENEGSHIVELSNQLLIDEPRDEHSDELDDDATNLEENGSDIIN